MDERNSVAGSQTITGTHSAQLATKVVPLLSALSRGEELVAALATRLDPITNHIPQPDKEPSGNTVTARVNQIGDVLQYLLDNIEL